MSPKARLSGDYMLPCCKKENGKAYLTNPEKKIRDRCKAAKQWGKCKDDNIFSRTCPVSCGACKVCSASEQLAEYLKEKENNKTDSGGGHQAAGVLSLLFNDSVQAVLRRDNWTVWRPSDPLPASPSSSTGGLVTGAGAFSDHPMESAPSMSHRPSFSVPAAVQKNGACCRRGLGSRSIRLHASKPGAITSLRACARQCHQNSRCTHFSYSDRWKDCFSCSGCVFEAKTSSKLYISVEMRDISMNRRHFPARASPSLLPQAPAPPPPLPPSLATHPSPLAATQVGGCQALWCYHQV
jgi:hypothetical protein